MFHHILLPESWWTFFPLTSVRFAELLPALREKLVSVLGTFRNESDIVTPFQITLPMGFTWAVYIAQRFANGVLRQCIRIFRMSRACPDKTFRVISASDCTSPTQIRSGDLLLMHYIADVNAVALSWPRAALVYLMQIFTSMFAAYGFPFKTSQSSRPGCVETAQISFVGFNWSFAKNLITPSPGKLKKVVQEVLSIVHNETATVANMSRVIGKLKWYALPVRSLLSVLRHSFAWMQKLSPESSSPIHLSPASRRELAMAASLLPLGCLSTRRTFHDTVLAFDACMNSGAVVYAPAYPSALLALAQLAGRPTSPHQALTETDQDNNERYISLLTRFVQATEWRTAITCRWKQQEHINGLEAASAVLSVEWLASTRVSNAHVLILTDSAVVCGALTKGRSSSSHLLARCRRLGAFTIAHNIYPHFIYVPTSINPADHPSRFQLPPR